MAEENRQTYKIKRIDFLNRHNVPIVLQNENGPCPLLAISNVLLLRNNINIHHDASEISLQDLLSLVAHRLLDTNLSNEERDEAYTQNQQQNVSDVIQMLPRLATGIDVNVRFRNTHDFEFTPETAIFDLLDISLVHGWLVDPQDEVTMKAVGSQSYNTLVEKLVALQEAYPDLAAKLLEPSDVLLDEGSELKAVGTSLESSSMQEGYYGKEASYESVNWDEPGKGSGSSLTHDDNSDQLTKTTGILEDDVDDDDDRPSLALVGRAESSAAILHEGSVDALSRILQAQQLDEGNVNDASSEFSKNLVLDSQLIDEPISEPSSYNFSKDALKETPSTHIREQPGRSEKRNLANNNGFLDEEPDDDDLDEEEENVSLKPDETSDVQPSLRVWLNEGETLADRMRSSEAHMGTVVEEATPPTLLEAGRSSQWRGDEQDHVEQTTDKDEAIGEELSEATKEGLLAYHFLSSTASQLTYHGLFSLQEGVKERELCVFFRNNHFNTIFKYEGALYILATDQGYYNQPNLVWEKLSEIEGDNQFSTGDFHIFHVENGPRSWAEEDEAAIVAAATREQVGEAVEQGQGQGQGQGHDYNYDLQLAFALQQQEVDEQKRRQRQALVPKEKPLRGASPSKRLVVGPGWSPVPAHAAKVEEKDKKVGSNCVVM